MSKLKTCLLAGLLLPLLLTPVAHADKIAVATYRTHASADVAYSGVMKALVERKYTLKFANKEQQSIQADKMAWGGGGETASVFITITKKTDETEIEATFTRRSGIIGGRGPAKWAQDIADTLKLELPDLVTTIK